MLKELTTEEWRVLESVNREVNEGTQYKTDLALYGTPEFWTIADGAGDCEDYALAKRKKLIELGWLASELKLAVVKTEYGDGHAVLTVDTSKGTFVLDNRYKHIMSWKSLPYEWISRQAGKSWVKI